jgi:pimeloyl-ACP methyl ester carboxylesterase
LILAGENDILYLPAAKYMAKTIKNSEHVIIPNAGHASNLENKAFFNKVVMNFLNR